MSDQIRLHYDRGTTAFVTGPKVEVRRRLAVCGDLSPIWVKRREAWATSTQVAARLLDQLEGRHVHVPVEDANQVKLDLSDTQPANSSVVHANAYAQGAGVEQVIAALTKHDDERESTDD